jgi:hypothetical protein
MESLEGLYAHTGAFVFLTGWGLFVGALVAWKGAKHLETVIALARVAEQGEGRHSGPAAFKSAYLAYLLTSLAVVGAAYAWLPSVLASFLFGLGTEQVGYAPLQLVVCASFLPLAAGALHQRRWRRRYRAEHVIGCPKCGRLNDRPRFPGHHRYFVISGYAAILDGDRTLCRWCQTPLAFPRLQP